MKSIIAAALLFSTIPATAQTSPLTEAAVRAKKAHNDCFFSSAAAQLNAIPLQTRKSADINMLAEQALIACTTEEQVLVALIRSVMQPANVQLVVLSNRTGLKRELSNVFFHPEMYAK
jgi:hypothetical protein